MEGKRRVVLLLDLRWNRTSSRVGEGGLRQMFDKQDIRESGLLIRLRLGAVSVREIGH